MPGSRAQPQLAWRAGHQAETTLHALRREHGLLRLSQEETAPAQLGMCRERAHNSAQQAGDRGLSFSQPPWPHHPRQGLRTAGSPGQGIPVCGLGPAFTRVDWDIRRTSFENLFLQAKQRTKKEQRAASAAVLHKQGNTGKSRVQGSRGECAHTCTHSILEWAIQKLSKVRINTTGKRREDAQAFRQTSLLCRKRNVDVSPVISQPP